MDSNRRIGEEISDALGRGEDPTGHRKDLSAAHAAELDDLIRRSNTLAKGEPRLGNVAEVSDLGVARHHLGHTLLNMEAVNAAFSVHDQSELKARAVEFIRRIREFDKLVYEAQERRK